MLHCLYGAFAYAPLDRMPPGDYRARRGPGGRLPAVRLSRRPQHESDRLGAKRLGHGADRGRRRHGPRWTAFSTPCGVLIPRKPASTTSKSAKSPAGSSARKPETSPAFAIRPSAAAAAPQPTIPADLATCELCLAESATRPSAAIGYPFTNCTNCGPRWSIIRQLPYDRPRTSMAEFALCPECQAEYVDPADRRFHAQPIACPDVAGRPCNCFDDQGRRLAAGAGGAGRGGRGLLGRTRSLALKGLGGFQLLVDATQADAAVAVLRRRKRRPDRPFALMFPRSTDVRRALRGLGDGGPRAGVSSGADPAAAATLAAPTRASPRGCGPGNPYLGVMLPYTPLHHLLMAGRRPAGGLHQRQPFRRADGHRHRRRPGAAGAIADGLLVHDRPIVRPVDDSVVQRGPEGLQVLRRARGYAPLPIALGRRRARRCWPWADT